MIKFFYNIYAVISLVFYTLFYLERIDDTVICIVSLFAFFIQLLLFLKAENSKKDDLRGLFMRPFYLLLACSIIVNFQSIVNVLCGLGQFHEYVKNNIGLSKYMPDCLYIGLIEISLLLLGYVNAPILNKMIGTQKEEHNEKYTIMRRILLFLLVLLFLGFVATIDIASFISGSDYLNSGAYDRSSNKSAYFEQLFGVILVVVIALYSKANTSLKTIPAFLKSYPIIFWCVFGTYMILRLLSGDRGPVMYNVLVMLFAFIYVTKKRIKPIMIFSGGLAFAFLITLFGIVRSQAFNLAFVDKIEMSFSEFLDSKYSNSVFPATQELANSIDCTALSIAGIDRKTLQLGYGKYNLYELASSVPGSNTFLDFIIEDFNPRKYLTAEIVTEAYAGSYYSFGLGTTAIADVFLDFGLWGFFILFPFFGIIFKQCDFILLTRRGNSVSALIFSLYIASYSIYIPRASFMMIISKGLYAVIIYVILSKILILYKK